MYVFNLTYMNVIMCVCNYVYMYFGCMYVRTYVHMWVVYVSMYVCRYLRIICMNEFEYVCMEGCIMYIYTDLGMYI